MDRLITSLFAVEGALHSALADLRRQQDLSEDVAGPEPVYVRLLSNGLRTVAWLENERDRVIAAIGAFEFLARR